MTGPGNSAAVTKVHVEPGQYQLAETGPAGYQQTSLTCAPGSVSGSTVTLVAGDDVTCTFTNTAAHPVVLTKAWQDATAGDTVGLQITNGATTATGTSTAPSTTTDATLTALAGDTVALAETFTTGDPASYATTLGCDNGVTVANGSFTVPSTLSAGTTITCTFTNARRSATMTLRKSWVNGAAGDTADLSIDGATSGARVRHRDRTATRRHRAVHRHRDQDRVLRRHRRPGRGIRRQQTAGSYTTGLTCSDSAGLVYAAGALSGSVHGAGRRRPTWCARSPTPAPRRR